MTSAEIGKKAQEATEKIDEKKRLLGAGRAEPPSFGIPLQ
jgi:hypothetical protein